MVTGSVVREGGGGNAISGGKTGLDLEISFTSINFSLRKGELAGVSSG